MYEAARSCRCSDRRHHGIGAATARILAACEAAVVVSYWRVPDLGEEGGPELYRSSRAADATQVASAIKLLGGRVLTIEADVSDATTPGACSMPLKPSSDQWTS